VIVPALQLLFPPDFTSDQRDLLLAELQDLGLAAVHEIGEREWRVFFRTADARDAARLATGAGVSATPLDLPDEDWARRSQEALGAITVGRLVIAPPWDVPEARGQGPEAVIVIEPSMGFGTGHHATTRLCLRALQRLPLRGSSVLDVGTGSGILAIAAATLGAAPVVAIDNDPDAISAARSNIERNAVKVDARPGELSDALPASDVVLANLTGAVLRRDRATLMRLARRTLIVSGILTEEAEEVRRTFSSSRSVIDGDEEDGWLAFTVAFP
jgi:ribosomal protein L11 methyltransferase